MSVAAIEVHKLSKTYKGSAVPAVNKVTFRVQQGEIFGLLGPNGAGKTTTISILCGLVKHDSGQVIIQGLQHKSDHEKIKEIIGVVPQDIALFPALTAFENLRYIGNMYGLRGDELKASIHDHLEVFGLAGFANKAVSTYSGGMKRRVNLIAGILHRPGILFLDEPTVGVDVQSRSIILSYLQNLNKNGTTIIYTSHHMMEAQNLCTGIIIMDYGHVIASGKPLHLMEQHQCGTLEEVFLKLTGRNPRD